MSSSKTVTVVQFVVIVLAVAGFLAWTGVPEEWHDFTRAHEARKMDDLFGLFPGLLAGMAWLFHRNFRRERKLRQELQRSEIALAEAHELNQRIIAASPVGIAMYDAKGQCVAANEATGRLIGATRAQFLSQNYNDLDSWKKTGLLEKARQAVTGHSIIRHEVNGFSTFGKRILLDCFLIPFRWGQETRLLLLISDIFPLREAERRLLRQHAALERSNAELQQFAYVASHDLQEPLNVIEGYLALLNKRYKGRIGDDADEFIGHTLDAADRMKRLIKDLLQYSRVETRGKAFEPTDMNSVVDDCLANLRQRIESRAAVIEHDALPTVAVDRSQMVQLFQNLVGNAVTFVRQAIPPRIHIGVERQGAVWIFSVRDNGIGIDPRQFEKIFVIFQRLHAAHEYPGTGIGLAICRRIVERHGGRIWVESAPGEGSSFLFTLPVERDDEAV